MRRIFRRSFGARSLPSAQAVAMLEKGLAGRILHNRRGASRATNAIQGHALRLIMRNGEHYQTQDRFALAGPADRVIFLDGGVLLEDGPPEDVLVRPQNPRTQDFLRRILQS